MRTLAISLLIAMTSPLLGCGDEGPPPPPPMKDFRLEVSATEPGGPVPLAPVLVDGKVIGYTDQDGKFEAMLTERPGASVTLGIGSLAGYRLMSDESVTESLRLTSSGLGVPVALNASFESQKKEYMVWVSANCDPKMIDPTFCENLPVLKDGEEIGRTDDMGQAHIVFVGVPETKVKFSINTPSVDPLKDPILPIPENPTFEVGLGFNSEIFLIEESFVNALEARKTKASPRRSAPAKKRVIKRAPPKKKEDPRKKGEIDLW